jgi:DNA-binding GntR family transcriptional regulator
LTARKAAQNVTDEAVAELRQIVQEMERVSRAEDVQAWRAVDERYHDLVFVLADNERLRRFQEELNNQLYRLWVGYAATEGSLAVSCHEHRCIAEMICDGKPDSAAAAALQHSRNLRASLYDLVEKVLVPFLGEEL